MSHAEDVLKDLVSLPAAAEVLGLHRATVNEMVNTGRLRGYRMGPHWYIRRSELEIFAREYRRPKNVPRRRHTSATRLHWSDEILRWLALWETATSEELHRVIDLHLGNIRKYLVFCEQDGLATRDDCGYWSLTVAGRTRAFALPPAGQAAAS